MFKVVGLLCSLALSVQLFLYSLHSPFYLLPAVAFLVFGCVLIRDVIKGEV